MKKTDYQEITKTAHERIERLALCANKSTGSEETKQYHRQTVGNWAYGVYLMWEQLTGGMAVSGWNEDSQRLRDLANSIARERGEG